MQLLPEHQVNATISAKESERVRRIKRMNDEETAAADRLNKAKAAEEKERQELDDRVQNMRNRAAAEITDLEVQIQSRRAQLADLMKPIDEIRTDAEARLAGAKQKEVEALDREDAVAAREEELAERMLSLKEREEDVVEKNKHLCEREQRATNEEKRLKESQQALATKWTEHYATVAAADANLVRREKEVSDMTKANEVVRESLRAVTAQQADERRALRDGYAALEQAKKHLGIQ